MTISFRSCPISENQIRALTDSLASKDGKVQIKDLDLSGDKLTYKSLDDLLHRASSAFQSLEYLSLTDYKLEPENNYHDNVGKAILPGIVILKLIWQ